VRKRRRATPIEPSRRERAAGAALFLVVTACWVVGFASAEQDWIRYEAPVVLIAAVLSAVSVVVAGYLGRTWAALWLGWVPGAATMAIGFAMTPTPGGDETGGTMVFVGGLLLVFGWPGYFFPLIFAGAGVRAKRARRLATSSGSSPEAVCQTPRT
jgi:hypothetical protein